MLDLLFLNQTPHPNNRDYSLFSNAHKSANKIWVPVEMLWTFHIEVFKSHPRACDSEV